MKMMGSTSDCLIFLYLGMAVMGNQVWHTGKQLKGYCVKRNILRKLTELLSD
jgi:hypothetical protein